MAVSVHGKLTSKHIQKDIQVVDKKIYGLQFPFKNNKRGYFSKQQGVELVRNNLRQLLHTERGERIMLPNYGVSLKKFLFAPLDEQLFNLVMSEIVTSVNNYMPTVEITKLSIVSTEEINSYGTPGLVITMVVNLTELDSLAEVQVTIG